MRIGRRGVFAGLLLVALAQVALVQHGREAWPCPLRSGLGVACPGCGMSRALVAAARGDLAGAGRQHPFWPFAALAGSVAAVAVVAPARVADRMVAVLPPLSGASRAWLVLLASLLAWWIARLALDPSSHSSPAWSGLVPDIAAITGSVPGGSP